MKLMVKTKRVRKIPSKLNFDEQQILAQDIFDDGNQIEAFVVLHGLIEIFMNYLWELFCAGQGMFDEKRDEIKKKGYLSLVEILSDVGLMEKKTRQQLLNFNARRNALAHNLYGAREKRSTKAQIKSDWDDGLNASGTLPVLMVKHLHQESKKNPKLKKNLKKEFGLEI